jgi:hypothetical protein
MRRLRWVRPAQNLPMLATIPRSGTWFLRYAIAFLCHLERGGRVRDRLTHRVAGTPSGPDFDFERFKGGPLFFVSGTLPADYLFIGHTVCPGFSAPDVRGWTALPFHVPGYDYFHEGMNYWYTPIDLAPYDYVPVRVKALERAARRGRGGRITFVYRNPLSQAASYLHYCREHKDPSYSLFKGRRLAGVPLQDFLFDGGLVSYAKMFLSFQAMEAKHPGWVRLTPYEQLMADPVNVLADILDHLSERQGTWRWLPQAVSLARLEHLKAIELELGRSLDGTRKGRGSHMRQGSSTWSEAVSDSRLRRDTIALLRQMGVNTDLFEWPPMVEQAAVA